MTDYPSLGTVKTYIIEYDVWTVNSNRHMDGKLVLSQAYSIGWTFIKRKG